MKAYMVDSMGIIEEVEYQGFLSKKEAIQEAIKIRERNIAYYSHVIKNNQSKIHDLKAELNGKDKTQS